MARGGEVAACYNIKVTHNVVQLHVHSATYFEVLHHIFSNFCPEQHLVKAADHNGTPRLTLTGKPQLYYARVGGMGHSAFSGARVPLTSISNYTLMDSARL